MIAARNTRTHQFRALVRDGAMATPAYVYDLNAVQSAALANALGAEKSDVQLLYASKACDIPGVLATLSQFVDGFSCSSLNEIHHAHEWSRPNVDTHWISPIITRHEAGPVFGQCGHVTLNSIGQLWQHKKLVESHGNVGLRVNLGTSFVDDNRYDPFSPGSRLGVFRSTIDALDPIRRRSLRSAIRGLHFHSNCDSTTSQHLSTAADSLVEQFGDLFHSIEWVNIGGGYLPNHWHSWDGLQSAADTIRSNWGCAVLFEPGADFVRDSGYLVTSVSDIVDTPSGKVAVLDTTVNHWPEVFEFQFEPDVAGHSNDGDYKYTLAGRSCLAGDIFGDYCFRDPLRIDDTIVMTAAGAYSIVKAHEFNGLCLPQLYYFVDGQLVPGHEFDRHLPIPAQ